MALSKSALLINGEKRFAKRVRKTSRPAIVTSAIRSFVSSIRISDAQREVRFCQAAKTLDDFVVRITDHPRSSDNDAVSALDFRAFTKSDEVCELRCVIRWRSVFHVFNVFECSRESHIQTSFPKFALVLECGDQLLGGQPFHQTGFILLHSCNSRDSRHLCLTCPGTPIASTLLPERDPHLVGFHGRLKRGSVRNQKLNH